MKKLFLLFIFSALIFSPQLVKAQGCDDDGGGEGEDDQKVKVWGFIQPQYEYHFTDPTTNTFKFKRARIGVTGKIPYDFKYYVMIENSAFVSASGYPYLLDAFVSYTRYKWAKFSMGSFKQPFGMEVNTPCHKLHTIERAMVSDQIVAPQRDMGFMMLGGDKETFMKYSLAIMNGRGLGIKDNNNKKDIIGRVTFKPLDFLSIGGSFRYGFPNTDTDDRITYGGELQVEAGNFLMQAEYIYDEGDYNRAAGGGCGSDPLTLGEKRSGAYVMAMYMTNFMLQPVLKWEYFDTDADIADNNMYITTIGINYFFNDWTRLQLNYQYKAEKGAEIPNDALLVQIQIQF